MCFFCLVYKHILILLILLFQVAYIFTICGCGVLFGFVLSSLLRRRAQMGDVSTATLIFWPILPVLLGESLFAYFPHYFREIGALKIIPSKISKKVKPFHLQIRRRIRGTLDFRPYGMEENKTKEKKHSLRMHRIGEKTSLKRVKIPCTAFSLCTK